MAALSPFVADTEPAGAAPEAPADFEFGEAEDESAHPLLSLFPVPTAVLEALSRGLPAVAVGLAAAAGFRDVNQLTNVLFYFRHPDRVGRKIEASERDLAAEWISIRDRIVKPALPSAPAGGAMPPTPAPAPPSPFPAAAATAPGPELSSSRLQWPGVSDEKLAFMRAVYDRHAERSRARGAGFVADLPASALATVARRPARKDAAAAARKLLEEAQAALAPQGIKVGIVSGYRPATKQFEIWQGLNFDGTRRNGGFPVYYAKAIKLKKLREGDYGPGAVDAMVEYLGKYIASPGYSNHQDGLAFDFGETGPRGFRTVADGSPFHKWLKANAARHHFEPLDSEAWHWTYRPPGRSGEIGWASEVASSGVRAGRLEVARVPVLATHRGGPPDMVLRWNDMATVPQEIDVVVHLHGFWYPRMTLKRDIEPVSGLDLMPIERATGAGRTRPTLTVLPRGHYTGVKQQHGSYYAYTFPALVKKDGIPRLVRFSLERFAAEVGGTAPRLGRLILTAHSGGGMALLAILRDHNPHQVHVFDALYWKPDVLAEWARKRIRQDRAAIQAADPAAAREYMSTRGGALRVFYQDRFKGGTRPFSLALRDALASELDAGVADSYRVEASRYDHFQIPRRYGWRVLADASASVPDAYVEPSTRREAELDEAVFEADESPAQEWAAEPATELWAEEDEGEDEDAAELWASQDEDEDQDAAELWASQDEDEDEDAAEPEAQHWGEEGSGAEPPFAEIALEGEAPPDALAARMLDALGRGLWDTAVRIAIGSGITDANKLTNTLFYLANPQLRGQKIGADQHDLARQWIEIRDRWVTPALRAHAASPAPAATSTATLPGASVRLKRHPKGGYAAYGGGRLDAALRRLVASGVFTISERDIDTLQRVAEVESAGLASGVNSYDDMVMSIGFKQYTLGWGELQRIIKRAPEAFARHGIRLAPAATYVFVDQKGKRRSMPAIDGVPDKETLRNEDWSRRFFLASLEPEAVAAVAENALAEIAKLEGSLRENRLWSPHFESPRGRALLVELHNNRPAYVKYAVPATLGRAKQQPDIDEDAFLAIFVAEIIATYERLGRNPAKNAAKARGWTAKMMRRR